MTYSILRHSILKRAAAALLAVLLLQFPPVTKADAADSVGIFFNDTFFRKDRWFTGGYYRTWDFNGFGINLNSAIFAPQSLYRFNRETDRPYADVLSLGVSKRFDMGDTSLRLGATRYMAGPQTGLENFQNSIHEYISYPQTRLKGYRIEDKEWFGLDAEIAHSIELAHMLELRPYLRGDYQGITTDLTFGADLFLMLEPSRAPKRHLGRDPIMQQPLFANSGGSYYVLGAHISKVFSDQTIDGVAANTHISSLDYRAVVRSGIVRGKRFWGVYYRTPTFSGQEEGQFLGGLSVSF